MKLVGLHLLNHLNIVSGSIPKSCKSKQDLEEDNMVSQYLPHPLPLQRIISVKCIIRFAEVVIINIIIMKEKM